MRLYALGFSLPLMLLALLGARLEERFGAAYTGLYGGLAQTLPRMSGVLVGVVLAIVAAPSFPTFFAMLATVVAITPTMPLAALTVAGVWLLWSWAGTRLLQGLIVGPANGSEAPDLSVASPGLTPRCWSFCSSAGSCSRGIWYDAPTRPKSRFCAMIYLAGEPIPYFWPMRSFIHHNPLHGLEHPPFSEAVEEGRRMFHAKGFLNGPIISVTWSRGRSIRRSWWPP